MVGDTVCDAVCVSIMIRYAVLWCHGQGHGVTLNLLNAHKFKVTP